MTFTLRLLLTLKCITLSLCMEKSLERLSVSFAEFLWHENVMWNIGHIFFSLLFLNIKFCFIHCFIRGVPKFSLWRKKGISFSLALFDKLFFSLSKKKMWGKRQHVSFLSTLWWERPCFWQFIECHWPCRFLRKNISPSGRSRCVIIFCFFILLSQKVPLTL